MSILFYTAVILILAKIFSHLASRLGLPPVLGMLVLGLLLGPSGLHLIETNDVLKTLADVGVVVLLFMAGLETDLTRMRREGRPATLTALGGVVFPFVFGFCLAMAFHLTIPQSLLLATALTATSVSIPVITLFDLGKLRGPEGRTILGAAVIDDIMAVLILAFTIGLVGGGAEILASFGKIALFLVIACTVGLFTFRWLVRSTMRLQASQALLAIALGILLIYASGAELCGMASITGAYLAGLFLGRTEVRRRLLSGMDTIGHALFISIFFVHVGLQADIEMVGGRSFFLILYILVAILGKFVGCGLGARAGGLPFLRSLRVGIGMIPRGEVALAVTSMAMSRGLIGASEFSSTVLLVLITAFVTPPLLKWSFASDAKSEEIREENDVSAHNHTE
jgi:Kef-type K+ transport system membrane component KefB